MWIWFGNCVIGLTVLVSIVTLDIGRQKKMLLLAAGVVGMISMQNEYNRRMNTYIEEKQNDCPEWHKWWNLFLNRKIGFRCADPSHLSQTFRQEFDFIRFFMQYGIFLLISVLTEFVLGMRVLHYRMIDGVGWHNWMQPSAWFRSIVYNNLLLFVFYFAFVWMGFQVVFSGVLSYLWRAILHGNRPRQPQSSQSAQSRSQPQSSQSAQSRSQPQSSQSSSSSPSSSSPSPSSAQSQTEDDGDRHSSSSLTTKIEEIDWWQVVYAPIRKMAYVVLRYQLGYVYYPFQFIKGLYRVTKAGIRMIRR